MDYFKQNPGRYVKASDKARGKGFFKRHSG